VQPNFTAAAPDQLWVADITYIPTWTGFLYLAVVLDAFSRRIVGWAMETSLRTELVLNALNMALQQRRPTSVIHHSDQGASIPRSPSANAATRLVCGPRWAQ
jgi:putative transposase